MNNRQKWVLISFIVAALLIGAFPPWRFDIGRDIHRAIGFHFLFSDQHIANEPGHENSFYIDARIDMTKLEVEWVTLTLLCTAFWILFATKHQEADAGHLEPERDSS